MEQGVSAARPAPRQGSARAELVARLWRGNDPFRHARPDPARVDMQGWASNHPAFEQAIRELRPRLIVEVGVWKGASVIHMAKLLRQHGVDGVVLAVDTWLGSSENWLSDIWFPSLQTQDGYPTLYRTFVANVLEADVQDLVLPLPLDSGNAAVLLRQRGIMADMLHVDAGHDLGSVEADLRAWWPLLRAGGALIGDDYFPAGDRWPGVKAAFDTFTGTHRLEPVVTVPKIRLNKPLPETTFDPASMPEKIGYKGEFGSELVVFLPYVTWLSEQGLLRDRYVVSYPGMECFYRHLDCKGFLPLRKSRGFIAPAGRGPLPVRNEDDFDGTYAPSPMHRYPDFRRLFSDFSLHCRWPDPAKPLLIVHNKYNAEWWFGRPVNHITADALEAIFATLGGDYTIVYVRHGLAPAVEGYDSDADPHGDLGDREVLARFPSVLEFHALYAEHIASGGKADLNGFKSALYARCHHFISAQGGGTYQMAYYSGSLLLVLHRVGPESRWSYTGFFTWLASPPVSLAVATTNEELLRGLALFRSPSVQDGIAVPPTEAAELREALAPTRAEVRALPLPQERNRVPPPL
ncbi:class I SAM-dependent methyltransferase [Falsiroseomonas oryziterrae]|uniref:class I SAM-dependent methyltransferase n=1 Tax=Falsiroseomonas oryziterrae TaxID=2911368 RepID=UPI001F428D5E|nr:class I SAM-dependent methyltransferase [Roseomonas sp. NPKOSM-4]